MWTLVRDGKGGGYEVKGKCHEIFDFYFLAHNFEPKSRKVKTLMR